MDRQQLLAQLNELKSTERKSKVERYDPDGNFIGEQDITAQQYEETRYVPPDPYDFEFDTSEVDAQKQKYEEAKAKKAATKPDSQPDDTETTGDGNGAESQPQESQSGQGGQSGQSQNGNGEEQSPMTKQTLEELQKQLDEAKVECEEGLAEDPDSKELQESKQQLDKLQEKLDAHKQALAEQQGQNGDPNQEQQSGQQPNESGSEQSDQQNGQSEEKNDQSGDAESEDKQDKPDQQDGQQDDKSEEASDKEDESKKEAEEQKEDQQQTPQPEPEKPEPEQKKEEQKEEELVPPDQAYYKPSWYQDMKNLVMMGFDVLVCGPAGCGKSRAGREIGRELKKPGNTHAFRAGMRKSELLYSKELRGGDSVIELSPLLREVQKPLITVIDEALSVDPEVLICFNGLLESSQRSVDTPIGEVVRDKEHRFILTSNTDGRSESRIYRAPQMQDASILSRVMVMNVDYDEKVECNIACSSGAPAWKYIVHNTHALRKAVRKADMVMDISTRWIVQACKLNKAGVAREKAFAMAMLDRFNENELKKLQGMGTTIDFSGASKLQK
jgi:AAA ATPase containing von Willebrand factor type A (vWA) domain